MNEYLIYGANGYTGALIAREAARQGHRPILAGRNAEAAAALATELNVPKRAFPVDNSAALAAGITGVRLVLNCAGLCTMRKSHDKRTPEDYRDAADDALELAKVLAGEGALSDQDFLERMARSDAVVEHDGESCGLCHNMILGAQVAREMIDAGEYEGVEGKWAAEARRRWEQSKLFRLWQDELRAGRDPRLAFQERGWEP